jgi:hypothetical protein
MQITQATPVRAGRFPKVLLCLGLGIPILLAVLAASPLETDLAYVVVGIPSLLVCWLVVGCWSAALCAGWLVQRQNQLAVKAAILPAVLVAVVFNPLRFVHFCNYCGDVVHFVLARHYYDGRIASMPATEQPRLIVFNWGGMIWASRGLVYDESDQVALPPGQQSEAWLAQAASSELGCRGYSVQALWSHYYLAQFPC